MSSCSAILTLFLLRRARSAGLDHSHGVSSTESSSSGLSAGGCALLCHFGPMCELSGCTVVGAAVGLALAVGVLAVGPALSQIVFSRPPQRSLKFGPSMAMTMDLDLL